MFKHFNLRKSRASSTTVSVEPSPSECLLYEKYGHAERVIGKGAGGVVKLFHKGECDGMNDKLFAVKVTHLNRIFSNYL